MENKTKWIIIIIVAIIILFIVSKHIDFSNVFSLTPSSPIPSGAGFGGGGGG